MIVVESLINNVTYVVELSDVSTLSISQAIAAKNTSELVLEQVNNQKAAIETIQALVQDLRDQSEAFWTSSGESASSALANKNATDVNLAQTLSALNSAVQVAMGQATGIAGIIPTARIRANSAFLNPEFTFIRGGSSATFFNRNLRLVTAPPNSARFDFDPLTGHALGVLVETAKTNFVLHSNDFSNASWGKSGLTPVPNSGVSVEGVNNAWFLRESLDSVASQHIIDSNPITINGGNNYTFSFFAQAGTRSLIRVLLPGTDSWAGSTGNATFLFNLANGTSMRIGGTVGTSSMLHLGNGIYRCSIEIPATANGSSEILMYTQINQTTTGHTYIGDGVSGLFLYGVQAEVGGLSSYIPTTSAAVTRNVDDLFTQNISTWNQTEGTIIIRVRNNTAIDSSIFLAWDQTGNNQFQLRTTGLLRYVVNGVLQSINSGSSGQGVFDIWAISYTPTRVAVSRNGGTVQSINVSQNVTVNQIWFSFTGISGAGISQSKHIHTYQYKRKALTDAELIVRSNPATFFGFENGDVALNADLGDAAFVNVNAIQRLPMRSDIPFLGTGAAAQRIFSLDFASTLQLVHLPAGGTYSVSAGTTVVPGTTVIPAGTNITVDFNVANNNVLILAFLPAII